MQIRVGFDLTYRCPQPTPMILTLSIHYSHASDLAKPDYLIFQPSVPVSAYRDPFGNWCSRIVAPQGSIRVFSDAIVNDSRSGSEATRSVSRSANAARSAISGYRRSSSGTVMVSRPAVRNPRFTACKVNKLRTSRPAPTRRATDNATSATTNAPRSLLPCPSVVVELLSFKVS